jgi:hypothetical protein
MGEKDFQDQQYVLCTKHNNHPKEDLQLCKECKLNRRCLPYQEYIQPQLPWVKVEDKAATNDKIKSIAPGEITAICSRCRHYHGNSSCEAYPHKIPAEILLGYVSHTRPYKGDQGIQFEPDV